MRKIGKFGLEIMYSLIGLGWLDWTKSDCYAYYKCVFVFICLIIDEFYCIKLTQFLKNFKKLKFILTVIFIRLASFLIA